MWTRHDAFGFRPPRLTHLSLPTPHTPNLSPLKTAQADLESRWEVLAEPIQTVMRRYGAPRPYEQLKDLTRGNGAFTAPAIHAFIAKLEAEKQVPAEAAAELRALTPSNYVGHAPALARGVRQAVRDLGLAI